MSSTEHSPGPVTAFGHVNYQGYDATVGKFEFLHGRAHRCAACERKFKTAESLHQHQHDKHSGEGP